MNSPPFPTPKKNLLFPQIDDESNMAYLSQYNLAPNLTVFLFNMKVRVKNVEAQNFTVMTK